MHTTHMFYTPHKKDEERKKKKKEKGRKSLTTSIEVGKIMNIKGQSIYFIVEP